MKTNSKRLTRAVLIGLVGVLVLSVSAFAAWGSSSGYGKYKDAVTKVFTETDNVTIDADASIIFDEQVAHHNESQYKINGKDYSTYDKNTSLNGTEEYFCSLIGTTEICFYDDETYYQYESDPSNRESILSLGDYGDKVIQFAKIFADTVLGDLKNNVVLVDKEAGVRSYTLDISGDQVPALINSGIDLILTSGNSNGGYVTYEDVDKTFAAYYEKTYGTPLAEDYFDVLYDGDSTNEMWDEYNDIYDAMDEEYQQAREEHGEYAIVYVNVDGSYDVYDNYGDYAKAREYGTNNYEAYIGKNAVLSKVKFDFALDEKDRLVSNDLLIRFDTTDNSGESHVVDIVINVDFSDYGTTEVVPFDVGDRTLHVDD